AGRGKAAPGAADAGYSSLFVVPLIAWQKRGEELFGRRGTVARRGGNILIVCIFPCLPREAPYAPGLRIFSISRRAQRAQRLRFPASRKDRNQDAEYIRIGFTD